jgi:hypothetical protein
MVALKGASEELPAAEYQEFLDRVGFEPDVLWLQRQDVASAAPETAAAELTPPVAAAPTGPA